MSSDASWPFPLEETGACAGRGRWGAVKEREREREREYDRQTEGRGLHTVVPM
jgi:hypothetical protein